MFTAQSSCNRAHRLVEAEVVDPGALSEAERNTFLGHLYEVNRNIFAGVSKEEFADDITRPRAVRSRVQIYRNELGAMVGYCAVHLFEIRAGRRTLGILRAEAGLLAGYRGSGTTLWFGGKEALRYKALHPLRTVALFATPVHPSSYHMLCKYFWRCYPYPGRRIPKKWSRLLFELCQLSGDAAVDPTDPFIRRVGWITRESDADTAAWSENPNEDVRFYLARNPGYRRGYGLAMISPLSVGNFVVSSIHYVWHFVPHVLGAWRSRLGRAGGRCHVTKL